MAANNIFMYTLMEGQPIDRPPFFNGDNYAYWKERMIIFVQSIDYNLWKIIMNGPNIPTKKNAKGEVLPKEDTEWTEEEKKKVEMNAKAMNMILCSISLEEFKKVFRCKTAKEIWDKLQLIHEGTQQVRDIKINMLMKEYDSFFMMEDESMDVMFERFSIIINNLDALGKQFSEEELVTKIFRSLTIQWKINSTAIQENIVFNKNTYYELKEKLVAYETRYLKKDNKKKGVALKSKIISKEEYEDSSSDEELKFICRRLRKLMRQKNNDKGSSSSRDFKKDRAKVIDYRL